MRPRKYSWRSTLSLRSWWKNVNSIAARWAQFPNKPALRHLWASYFQMCGLMDASVAAGDGANQVTIELRLFLCSSQGCTCQREWRRGSSRRTRYHVGGKKATSFSFEWVFSARCIHWREGSCGRFAVTCVRRLLIKSGRHWGVARCPRDASAVSVFDSWLRWWGPFSRWRSSPAATQQKHTVLPTTIKPQKERVYLISTCYSYLYLPLFTNALENLLDPKTAHSPYKSNKMYIIYARINIPALFYKVQVLRMWLQRQGTHRTSVHTLSLVWIHFLCDIL